MRRVTPIIRTSPRRADTRDSCAFDFANEQKTPFTLTPISRTLNCFRTYSDSNETRKGA